MEHSRANIFYIHLRQAANPGCAAEYKAKHTVTWMRMKAVRMNGMKTDVNCKEGDGVCIGLASASSTLHRALATKSIPKQGQVPDLFCSHPVTGVPESFLLLPPCAVPLKQHRLLVCVNCSFHAPAHQQDVRFFRPSQARVPRPPALPSYWGFAGSRASYKAKHAQHILAVNTARPSCFFSPQAVCTLM
eukprot:scaffold73178_cov17-Tisochrysis_lutea.AAC.1